MANILESIIAQKRKEVEEKKSLRPIKALERSVYFETQTVSLGEYVKRRNAERGFAVIAEFKRKSPSARDLNLYASIKEITIGYMQAGAAALSILTDTPFFGAQPDDLPTARHFNFCPILQKDFFLDTYQIYEAKSLGADIVLLIAKILEPQQIHELATLARSLNLQVLLEIHEKQELQKVPDLDLFPYIGINNRNLQSLAISLETSQQLIEDLPKGCVKVAESGIQTAEQMVWLKRAGFDAFLIGETFMKAPNPTQKCAQLIASAKQYETTSC